MTIDGHSRPLPQPFFVVATQNPVDFAGTYPLPDSQLDRFMMRMSLGYPDAASERAMLAAPDRRSMLERLDHRLTTQQVMELRNAVSHVLASEALIDYVQRLLEASRQHAEIRVGLSRARGWPSLPRHARMPCCTGAPMRFRKTCNWCFRMLRRIACRWVPTPSTAAPQLPQR